MQETDFKHVQNARTTAKGKLPTISTPITPIAKWVNAKAMHLCLHTRHHCQTVITRMMITNSSTRTMGLEEPTHLWNQRLRRMDLPRLLLRRVQARLEEETLGDQGYFSSNRFNNSIRSTCSTRDWTISRTTSRRRRRGRTWGTCRSSCGSSPWRRD